MAADFPAQQIAKISFLKLQKAGNLIRANLKKIINRSSFSGTATLMDDQKIKEEFISQLNKYIEQPKELDSFLINVEVFLRAAPKEELEKGALSIPGWGRGRGVGGVGVRLMV